MGEVMRGGRPAAALALTACLALTGCSGGGANATSSAPAATSGRPAGATSSGSGAKSAVAKIMAGTEGGGPIASAKGTVTFSGHQVPATAQVLRVQAGDDATVLVWRLRLTGSTSYHRGTFQFSRPPFLDSRDVSLINSANKKTYYPYTYAPQKQSDGQDVSCLCSDVPGSFPANGAVLWAILPPLPTGTSTVGVGFPGFGAISSVKVSP